MLTDSTPFPKESKSKTAMEDTASSPSGIAISPNFESTSMLVPDRIGHFRIVRKIGEGGMGVVYAAEDELLGRSVAIKMIRQSLGSSEARSRFWQEARSLARVNHPRICQIFEIHEDLGALFLVLELIEGQPLADRLNSGPIPFDETLRIANEILEALDALHNLNIIHRDLKPSNVFLTPHGVKLLDFGLAKFTQSALVHNPEGSTAATLLTMQGGLIGTPCYMAPEQIENASTGPAADLFAAGCVIYEMLAGRRAFEGDSVVDVLYRVKHEQPAALGGSPAISAIYNVISRALEKRPEDRYQSATEMSQALFSAQVAVDPGAQARSKPVKRLLALPFRILRKDDDTDFLAYSLPDAIGTSLSAVDGLIVRSSLLASRFDGMDLKKIAVDAGVDVVLTGTLLCIGEKLQVTSQLIELPGGSMIWSDSEQFALTDIFQLQNRLASRIVQSLVGQLTEREQEVFRRDVPADSKAYEKYLRANQIVQRRFSENLEMARDLYLECLRDDPSYAPAWARLGRTYRLLEKFGETSQKEKHNSDSAFQRAFSLNPDLTIAHHLYTSIETDTGHAPRAMVRLLTRANTNRNDPELYAGLVQSCRYCGELRASLVAHQHAKKLDPLITTSVLHTHFLLCDFEEAFHLAPSKGGFYLDVAALATLGRNQEALDRLREREMPEGRELEAPIPAMPVLLVASRPQATLRSLRLLLEGDRAGAIRELYELEKLGMQDPETTFYFARHWGRLEEPDRAIDIISKVIDQNFLCDFSLAQDPWFESVRMHPRYADLMLKAAERRRETHAAFVEAGGELILPSGSLTAP